MTTPKRTALLPIALVAIFAGTMISAPQIISPAYAQAGGQGPPRDTVPACPENYAEKPNPGGQPQPGLCQDGPACPPGTYLVNGKCQDGPPKCDDPHAVYNPTTDKCEAEGKCPPGFYLNKDTDKCEAIPDKKFCPAPIGGPGPGESQRFPEVHDGTCFIQPGIGGPQPR